MVLGPFLHEELGQRHISWFGVIPKASQPGKWRLIVDLSHPKGKSVNDGISPELCSLHYVKADDVAQGYGNQAPVHKINGKDKHKECLLDGPRAPT